MAMVIVGANFGQCEWRYRNIQVSALQYNLMGEVMLYREGKYIEEFWLLHIEQMIAEFFERNPAYHQAICW